MAPLKQEDVHALIQIITSTRALLTQFTTSLAPGSKIADQAIVNPPNPLNVARDASKLLKAQVTKLSLLAINKPFTPSAIIKILRDISGTCLPALMSAVQICQQETSKWCTFVATELRARVRRAFREVGTLLQELLNIAEERGSGETKRDSLSATGIVWAACDELVELDKLGVAGLAVRKAEQFRDTIKDAIEELSEWREGEDLDSETQGDALLDSDDEGVDGDADSIEDIFHAANSMPKDRPILRGQVESAEALLKRSVLLFTALIKRRLKTFPSAPSKDDAVRLDRIMTHLEILPNATDELAGVFYDLDEDQAKVATETCREAARGANSEAALDWKGSEDEFTIWSRKWEEAIK